MASGSPRNSPRDAAARSPRRRGAKSRNGTMSSWIQSHAGSGRTLTYTKTRATSVLRITYQDTLGSYANGYDRCRWRILVDTTQVAYFSDADLQYGTAWRMHNATHTALAAGVKPGKHTITVQSMMVPGGSECLMGWNTSQNFLAAEEVGL